METNSLFPFCYLRQRKDGHALWVYKGKRKRQTWNHQFFPVN
jgi:hypothetical protein